jgi:hypothetical protein
MGLFEKQTKLYEGTNLFLYQGYQQILSKHGIKFKAYKVDNRLQGGCCGINSGNGLNKSSYTYSIYVKEREIGAAKELISQQTTTQDVEG